jgi:flavoprotein
VLRNGLSGFTYDAKPALACDAYTTLMIVPVNYKHQEVYKRAVKITQHLRVCVSESQASPKSEQAEASIIRCFLK